MGAAVRAITKWNTIHHTVKGYCFPELSMTGHITHSGNLLVKPFAGIMEKVFQHFGHLEQGEARLAVALLRRMVAGWARRPGGPEHQLLLLVLFEEQVVEEALLRNRPVELLKAAVGEELAQVHTVVHEKAHKVRLVIN